MDTKVSNQSVPMEQVSNAEDVQNVTTTQQPVEAAQPIDADDTAIVESVDFSDEEAQLAADNAGIDLGEATPEEEAAAVQTNTSITADEQSLAGKSKSELVELFAQLLETKPVQSLRSDAEAVKIAFYKLRRAEVDAQRKEFIEAGGKEEDFTPAVDGDEVTLKEPQDAR